MLRARFENKVPHGVVVSGAGGTAVPEVARTLEPWCAQMCNGVLLSSAQPLGAYPCQWISCSTVHVAVVSHLRLVIMVSATKLRATWKVQTVARCVKCIWDFPPSFL